MWQTEDMHSLALGDFQLDVFSDGLYQLDGGAFFGIVPKVMWSKKLQGDERNYVHAGLNSLLIRTGGKTILIETGIGNKLSERMIKFYGQPAGLLGSLAARGIAPEDIDIVINTHLHFDHCGWNTVHDKQGKAVATFPRARYYAPQGEWQYSRKPSERDAISFISDNYDPLLASGQMTLLHGGEEIVPGVSVRTFPGHTKHMQAVMVESGGKTACYISDLMPTSAHIDVSWGMGFDLYPLETIESKKEYYARAIPEKWLTVFTHDPKMPWAYIEREATGKMVAREVW